MSNNVRSMSMRRHRIDVNMTLFQCCVPAWLLLSLNDCSYICETTILQVVRMVMSVVTLAMRGTRAVTQVFARKTRKQRNQNLKSGKLVGGFSISTYYCINYCKFRNFRENSIFQKYNIRHIFNVKNSQYLQC